MLLKGEGYFMVNLSKLKEIIDGKSTTYKDVADLIGIDKSTFYRKIKNGGDFSVKEAQKMVEGMSLTKEEAIEIFFNNSVAFTLHDKQPT